MLENLKKYIYLDLGILEKWIYSFHLLKLTYFH